MSPYFDGPVVCNTGPLIGLARVGLAHLPLELFPELIVPDAVRGELLVADSPDRDDLIMVLRRAGRGRDGGIPNPLLAAEVDAGEAAVIMTALETGVRSVIIDERKARRVAANVFGLEVRGTCGLLVEAKRRGRIEAVGPPLAGMIDAGYFIGPSLRDACLRAADEGAE